MGKWRRYGLALAAVAVTLILKLPLDQAVGRSAPFQLFSLAIVFSAWFGGLGPGLLATVLSTAIGTVFAVQVTPGTTAAVLRTAVFFLQGVGISSIGHLLERERLRTQGAAARLAQANQRAADILESINDAFFSLDREWRFTYANRVFERLVGRRAEDLAGKVFWEVYPQLAGTDYEAHYRRAVREQVPVRFIEQGSLSGRWYEIHAYPSEAGLSVFSTDIDERMRVKEGEEQRLAQIQDLAREAQEARAEAERANRLKDQFLATLSHELRTPLNAILGWAQILRAGRLDPEGMTRGLEAIERSSRAQAQLIGDLLDISRVISGKLRLEVRPVDPVDVIEAALATVLPAAQAKGVPIERFLDRRAGLVQADPDRLQQVVWNLLSNAVKFTPRGGKVEVHLAAIEGHAEIRVHDTGQGIAPELLPHIFELFRQGDGSSTPGQAGLGLGLSIVRELVELQGGEVRAESSGLGNGATFTVVLPLADLSAVEGDSMPIAREEQGARPPLAGLRLLAVDDEPDTLDVLAELLSLRGAEVATASSAAQALEVLQKFEPDVLLSDISMPGRDGYDLIREVRTGRGPDDLPAVAVTAFAGPEDRRRALAAGFQVHLAKPVDPGELVSVIARLADPGQRGQLVS
ncbi:MAG TPA: ATP-binding protein [Thermoanaerobaculia bacterium]|jgi:PAS domain S-box-containing protein|nr:ATP-binding protein [Thermoanaerobaculia bacterium]